MEERFDLSVKLFWWTFLAMIGWFLCGVILIFLGEWLPNIFLLLLMFVFVIGMFVVTIFPFVTVFMAWCYFKVRNERKTSVATKESDEPRRNILEMTDEEWEEEINNLDK